MMKNIRKTKAEDPSHIEEKYTRKRNRKYLPCSRESVNINLDHTRFNQQLLMSINIGRLAIT